MKGRKARHARTVALGAAVAFLTGCGTAKVGPPAIDAGQTTCAECGMAVSEPRYAAALLVADADEGPLGLVFDDIGCMLAYKAAHPAPALAQYVMDADIRQWLDARNAWFARSSAIRSPMASGLAACRTPQRVELLANQPGDVLNWTRLTQVWRRDRHRAD